MKHVNIYTYTSCRSPKRTTGKIAYILETQLKSGPRIRPGIEEVTATANQAEILAAAHAIGKLLIPCQVDLYTDSFLVANAYNEGWLNVWKENGWKTISGKEVMYQEEWKKLTEYEGEVRCHYGEDHPYRQQLKENVGMQRKD